MLADSQVESQSCVSSHPWVSLGERHVCLQDRIRDVWEQQFGVSQKSEGHCSVGALLQELKSAESPTPTANVPLRQASPLTALLLLFFCWFERAERSGLHSGLLTFSLSNVGLQVQLYSSLHLTRAVLSWLLDDEGQLMKELWKAVAWFRDAGHLSVSAELCRLLFPDGTSVCQSLLERCNTTFSSFNS